MKIKFYIVFIFSLIFPDEIFIGEVLKYQAGFRLFSAGEATLFFDWDTLAGDSVYFLNEDIKTNSFLDHFYRVRDNIKAWMSPQDFSLKKVEKNISQGKYRKKHKAEIDYLSNVISYANERITINSSIFDPLTIIYKIRSNLNEIDYSQELKIYDMGKIRTVLFRLDKNENIKVPYGSFNCFSVSPYSTLDNKLLKNNGQIKVWFTNDERMIPVKIEQITNIGIMVMELKDYYPN